MPGRRKAFGEATGHWSGSLRTSSPPPSSRQRHDHGHGHGHGHALLHPLLPLPEGIVPPNDLESAWASSFPSMNGSRTHSPSQTPSRGRLVEHGPAGTGGGVWVGPRGGSETGRNGPMVRLVRQRLQSSSPAVSRKGPSSSDQSLTPRRQHNPASHYNNVTHQQTRRYAPVGEPAAAYHRHATTGTMYPPPGNDAMGAAQLYGYSPSHDVIVVRPWDGGGDDGGGGGTAPAATTTTTTTTVSASVQTESPSRRLRREARRVLTPHGEHEWGSPGRRGARASPSASRSLSRPEHPAPSGMALIEQILGRQDSAEPNTSHRSLSQLDDGAKQRQAALRQVLENDAVLGELFSPSRHASAETIRHPAARDTNSPRRHNAIMFQGTVSATGSASEPEEGLQHWEPPEDLSIANLPSRSTSPVGYGEGGSVPAMSSPPAHSPSPKHGVAHDAYRPLTNEVPTVAATQLRDPTSSRTPPQPASPRDAHSVHHLAPDVDEPSSHLTLMQRFHQQLSGSTGGGYAFTPSHAAAPAPRVPTLEPPPHPADFARYNDVVVPRSTRSPERVPSVGVAEDATTPIARFRQLRQRYANMRNHAE